MSRDKARGAFDLVAAACRHPIDPTRDDRVRSSSAGADWSQVTALAARHRVEGLVVEALRRAQVEPPAEVARDLSSRAAAAARRALMQAGESVRLQGALDAAGVANLLLKGVAVDMLAWGRIGLKQAWDIDLLLEPGDVRTAAAVLADRGWVLTQPPRLDDVADWDLWIAHAKECALTHPETGLVVELHWRAVDAAGLLPGLGAHSPARRVPVSPGVAIRTLGPEETFAYLAVHGASHAWSRLKWLADVAAILAQADIGEREALWRYAQTLGAGRCAAVAMDLCERLLGVRAPDAVARAMRRDRRARWLVGLAQVALGGGNAREVEARGLLADAILASHLLFAERGRLVSAELARQWVSLHDRRTLALTPRWRGLYALVRIPLWVWRRVRRSGQVAGGSPIIS